MSKEGWRRFRRHPSSPPAVLSAEIREDEIPRPGLTSTNDADIKEDQSPARGLWKPFDVKEHTAKIQRNLAYLLLIVLSALNISVVAALIFGGLTVDELIRTMGALSGFQALAAAATGFYFGKSRG